MIKELEKHLPDFPGQANQTRCFAHTINLVAKSLLRQFDVPKKKAAADSDANDSDAIGRQILRLADEIEVEEAETEMNEDDGGNDNVDGWVDEVAALTEEERVELNESVQPVRLVLVKVIDSHHT